MSRKSKIRNTITWLAIVLSLVAAQDAAPRSFAVIHEVLTESEGSGSSIIIKLKGNPTYKVIGLQKKEILIALKDTELSGGLHSKEITGEGLIQGVEMNKRPNNVVCLLVKLRKPYTGIDHRIEPGKGRLHVRIMAEAGEQEAASTKTSPKKVLKPDESDSFPLQTKMSAPPPVTLSKAGGIDQLLNPVAGDNTPDTDLFLQATGHFQAGRWEEAIRILRKIIREYPKSRHLERAYFLLAKSFDRMFEKNIPGRFAEITKRYQAAISRFPDSVFVPDAMLSIGNCCAKAESYSEALAYYSIVYENYKDYPVASEALFQRGKTLASANNPQEAIKTFEQLERLYPGTQLVGAAKMEKAKRLFDMNRFEHSLRVFDEIITAEPNKVYEDPDILLYSGYNHYELGRLKEARTLFCKVFNYYPDMESNHLILTRIADTYRDQGMESKALKLYNMVLKKYPDSEGSAISMLRHAANIKNVEPETLHFTVPTVPIEEMVPYKRTAPETYKEIIKAHGDSPLSQLAELKFAIKKHEDKDYEGSINILRDILTKHPDTALRKQIQVAFRAPLEQIFEREQQAGNYGKIAGYYEQVKADLGTEDIPNLLLIIGDAYRRLHLYDNAVSAFEGAKESYTAQDQPAALLFGLGESFCNIQRFEEALQVLEDFITRYPEDRRSLEAYFLMGNVMLKQKEYEKAITAFHAAMQKDPDEPYRIKILLAIGEALNYQENYNEASRALNEAVTLISKNEADSFPGTYEAYQRLGETYFKLGENEQAVSAFEKALNVSTKGRDDHGVQFRLAECYQRLRQRDRAEGILSRIIASGDPFWSKMAESKIREMNIEESVDRLSRTLKTS